MNMDRKQAIAKLMQAVPMLAAIGEELSFTKAAERLNVDQSAVSHRARSLEEALGHTLFDRTTRSLRLTEVGGILCGAARESVAGWDRALDKLDRVQSTNLIHLSMPSSLAMKWFIPILPNARAMGLNISVDVNEQAIEFQANEADAAIRFGRGPYPGLHSSHLAHCWLQPVASPKYLEHTPAPETLLNHPDTVFLADRRGEMDGSEFSWDYYLSNGGLDRESIMPGDQFDRADLMLQAAIGGMGVGLGRTLLIEEDVKVGHLKPIGPAVRMQSAYWLVCSPSFAQTNRFETLHHWIKTEIRSITSSHLPID